MWRFYGPGDELRRASWFLDTQRYGLQPYGEDAQAVLEDAYMFLKWATKQQVRDGSSILLTVQVPSPDGSENQLVQFSSLTSATAINKGVKGAFSLFKRRVYRGIKPAKKLESRVEEDKLIDECALNRNNTKKESQLIDRAHETIHPSLNNQSLRSASLPPDDKGNGVEMYDNDENRYDQASISNGNAESEVKAQDEVMSLALQSEEATEAKNKQISSDGDSDNVDHVVLIGKLSKLTK
jgi:hypothetical protein